MANLALASGTAGLRIVGYEQSEPGWIDTGSHSDSNSTTIKGGRADLGVEARGWRIDLGGLFQRIDTADSQYTYSPGARSRPAQLAEPHDNDLNQASARAAGRIGDVDAVFVTSYSWHEVRDTLDATIGATSFGLANPQTFQDSHWYTVWDSEARFSGKLGAMQWLAGFDHVAATDHEWRNINAAGPALVIDDSHATSHDTVLFTDLTLPITNRVEVETGGRFYRSSLDATRLANAIQTGVTLTADKVTKTGLTPSAALIWRPQRWRMLWLRYGSAFRQGGLDYDNHSKVHPFAGDKLATIEAGWREQFAGANGENGGQIDADGFFTRWDDMQSDMLLANGLIETRNAGQARIFGVEVSLTQPVGQGWRLSLGATAQSAMLVRNRLGIALDDMRLPAIPEYTLRGGVEHGFHLAGASGRATLALRYLGPARLSFDPSLDRPMGKVLGSHLDVGLDWGRSTLAFRIDNLLNRASDSFAYGNPFRISTPQYTPQSPLSTKVSITRYF